MWLVYDIMTQALSTLSFSQPWSVPFTMVTLVDAGAPAIASALQVGKKEMSTSKLSMRVICRPFRRFLSLNPNLPVYFIGQNGVT